MRFPFLKLLLLAGFVHAALAQTAAAQAAAQEPAVVAAGGHPVKVGLSYTYLRSNILPGCNCVSLNGGSAEASVGIVRHVAALADLTVVHRGSITPDNYALTQTTYTFGVRVTPVKRTADLQPFAEVLVGGAHASGSLAPQNTGVGASNNSFALQAGGGLTLRLSERFALQMVHADYVMTKFANSAGNQQNDLRVSSGVTFRLGRR